MARTCFIAWSPTSEREEASLSARDKCQPQGRGRGSSMSTISSHRGAAQQDERGFAGWAETTKIVSIRTWSNASWDCTGKRDCIAGSLERRKICCSSGVPPVIVIPELVSNLVRNAQRRHKGFQSREGDFRRQGEDDSANRSEHDKETADLGRISPLTKSATGVYCEISLGG
jgi:hypothetical protein